MAYPNTFDSKEEKNGKDFILKYAKTVWSEAEDQRGSFDFSTRTARYIQNRKYAEGLHSIEKFKSQFSTDGDSTYLNFDWSVETPLPKFVDIVLEQIINTPYKPNLIPVDSTSLTKYDKELRKKKASFIAKQKIGDLIEKGVVEADVKDLPDTEEELNAMLETNFKLAESIALESIVTAVQNDNALEKINRKVARDLVVNKVSGVRVMLDENKMVKYRYIDPINLVTSVVENDDFSDAKHIGEIINITVEDLRVIADGQLSEEDLFNIAKSVAGRFDNPSWAYSNQMYYNQNVDAQKYNNFKVKVLDLEFFSTDKIQFQKMEAKNGGFYYQQKSEDYTPPKNPKRKREIKKVAVKNVYCAKYIIGTDYVFDYGLKEHMIRERLNGKYSTNTKLGFIVVAPNIYDMENKSMVERMIPYADELIRIQLKMQQVISKAAPAGYALDIDAIIGGLQGMGMGGLKPIDIRSMRDQIGDIYYKSLREDGTPITNTKPIQELPDGLGNGISILIAAYNATLERMKESIGMNDAIDASQPDKKALIGIQKIAAANTKNAIKPLVNAYLKINEEIVRQTAILCQQLIRKKVNVDKFEAMVGKGVIDQIQLSDLCMADFAINVKMLPDEEERAKIEELLALGIQQQLITSKDVFTIRRVAKEDVEKAEILLGALEEKNRKKKQQDALQQQQANAQVQMQSSQVAEQSKQQTLQVEGTIKAQVMEKEYALKLQFEKALEEERRKTLAIESEYRLDFIQKNAELKAKYGVDKDNEVTAPKIAGNVEPETKVSMPTTTA